MERLARTKKETAKEILPGQATYNVRDPWNRRPRAFTLHSPILSHYVTQHPSSSNKTTPSPEPHHFVRATVFRQVRFVFTVLIPLLASKVVKAT